MHDMESYDYREDYRNNRGDYRDDYRMNYRDDYGRNRRSYRGGNYRSQEEYTMMLEDIVDDGMELARNYEDVSDMASDSSEKQKLMKMAEREKEHYRTVKEILKKHM